MLEDGGPVTIVIRGWYNMDQLMATSHVAEKELYCYELYRQHTGY